MAQVMAVFRTRKPVPTEALEDFCDEDLMVCYGSGQVAAFELLLERHRRPVFNFILRSTRNHARAEELLQEVFFRVIKGASSYRRKSKFTTWLYTIARNQCVDHARRMSHRETLSLDEPMAEGSDHRTRLDRVAGPDGGAEQALADGEFARGLYAALDELPGEQREVFLMRQYQGLKFREIATITGASENTVKSRMRYALETLRERLLPFRDAAEGAL